MQVGWIVEEIVGVILTEMRSNVGDVEGEMIWIWSDDDDILSWHELGVVGESVGAASEVVWISAWMPMTVVVPTVDWTGPEGMDPSVLVEVDRSVDGEELAVVAKVQWAQ